MDSVDSPPSLVERRRRREGLRKYKEKKKIPYSEKVIILVDKIVCVKAYLKNKFPGKKKLSCH